MPLKYRKLLKQIINEYHKTSCKMVTSYNFPITRQDAEYLEANNLVNIKNYIDGEFAVTLTIFGITYFDDRRDKLIRFWVPTVISILSLLISAIALIVSLY